MHCWRAPAGNKINAYTKKGLLPLKVCLLNGELTADQVLFEGHEVLPVSIA